MRYKGGIAAQPGFMSDNMRQLRSRCARQRTRDIATRQTLEPRCRRQYATTKTRRKCHHQRIIHRQPFLAGNTARIA
jgi:hypothetical protein